MIVVPREMFAFIRPLAAVLKAFMCVMCVRGARAFACHSLLLLCVDGK